MQAIDKINGFDGSADAPVPSVEDYAAAGITGVTAGNLEFTNTVVANNPDANLTAEAIAALIDTTAPQVTSISMATTVLKAGDTTQVTITFSEKVKGLTVDDVRVENGVLGALSTADEGKTWTALFTPNSNTQDASNSIKVLAGGYTDIAGNLGMAGESANYTVDSKAPVISSVAITDAVGAQNKTLNAGDEISITVTLSEPVLVNGTPVLKLNIGGTIVNATYSRGSNSNTLIFKYSIIAGQVDTNGISIDVNSLRLNGGSITDLAGNSAVLTHLETASNSNFLVDTKAPTVKSIELTGTALKAGETSTVTITFSEKVTDFTLEDLTAANGTLSALATADQGKTWTATFTPKEDIASTTNVIGVKEASYTDLAGNAGSAGSSAAFAIDTAKPSVSTIDIAASGAQNNILNAGDQVTITVTMSESVQITGTPALQLMVGNTLVNATYVSATGTASNTLVFGYTILSGQTDSEGISVVANSLSGSMTDAAGNTAQLAHSSVDSIYSVDTTAPSAPVLELIGDTGASTSDTITNAMAPVAAEIMPGRPPTKAIRVAMEKEAYKPTLGSTPAMMEKAMASGISASATTSPANTSALALENQSSRME